MSHTHLGAVVQRTQHEHGLDEVWLEECGGQVQGQRDEAQQPHAQLGGTLHVAVSYLTVPGWHRRDSSLYVTHHT